MYLQPTQIPIIMKIGSIIQHTKLQIRGHPTLLENPCMYMFKNVSLRRSKQYVRSCNDLTFFRCNGLCNAYNNLNIDLRTWPFRLLYALHRPLLNKNVKSLHDHTCLLRLLCVSVFHSLSCSASLFTLLNKSLKHHWILRLFISLQLYVLRVLYLYYGLPVKLVNQWLMWQHVVNGRWRVYYSLTKWWFTAQRLCQKSVCDMPHMTICYLQWIPKEGINYISNRVLECFAVCGIPWN